MGVTTSRNSLAPVYRMVESPVAGAMEHEFAEIGRAHV